MERLVGVVVAGGYDPIADRFDELVERPPLPGGEAIGDKDDVDPVLEQLAVGVDELGVGGLRHDLAVVARAREERELVAHVLPLNWSRTSSIQSISASQNLPRRLVSTAMSTSSCGSASGLIVSSSASSTATRRRGRTNAMRVSSLFTPLSGMCRLMVEAPSGVMDGGAERSSRVRDRDSRSGPGSSSPESATASCVTSSSAATVYRHFPGLDDVLAACAARYNEVAPPPGARRWAELDDLRARLRTALHELFDYYGRAADILANMRRDVGLLSPPLAAASVQEQHEIRTVLERGWKPGRPSKRLRAALAHATDFTPWDSLVRRNGLLPAEAVACCCSSSRRRREHADPP